MRIVICFLVAVLANAQEKKVTKKEVPAAVISAFQKAYPEAKIKGYAKEIEEGKTYFEIESMNGKASLDALYLADGTVAEVEESIAPSALPSPVSDAVSAKHSGAKIVKAERTTHGNAVTYELRVTAGKTKMSMMVDPSGKVVKESKAGAKKEEKEERED